MNHPTMPTPPEQLLEELFRRLDAGDEAGIIGVLREGRARLRTEERQRDQRAQTVRFHFENGALTVRPVGPRLTDRAALIIRTEVNQRLLDPRPVFHTLSVDFRDVTTLNAAALTLFADLRRNATVFGVRTVGTGVAPEVEKQLRRFRLGQGRRRAWSRLLGS